MGAKRLANDSRRQPQKRPFRVCSFGILKLLERLSFPRVSQGSIGEIEKHIGYRDGPPLYEPSRGSKIGGALETILLFHLSNSCLPLLDPQAGPEKRYPQVRCPPFNLSIFLLDLGGLFSGPLQIEHQ